MTKLIESYARQADRRAAAVVSAYSAKYHTGFLPAAENPLLMDNPVLIISPSNQEKETEDYDLLETLRGKRIIKF